MIMMKSPLFLIPLFVLFVLVSCDPKTEGENKNKKVAKVVATLLPEFSDVGESSVKNLNSDQLKEWVNRQKGSDQSKKMTMEDLKPLAMHDNFKATLVSSGKGEAVIVKNLSVVQTRFTSSIVVIRGSESGDDDENYDPFPDRCHYSYCSGSSGICCLNAVSIIGDCPANECSGDKDCGEDCGKQDGDIKIDDMFF